MFSCTTSSSPKRAGPWPTCPCPPLLPDIVCRAPASLRAAGCDHWASPRSHAAPRQGMRESPTRRACRVLWWENRPGGHPHPHPWAGFARYLGSQTSHLLRQALSLQQELALLAEELHQLLGCGLAVLVQLLEPTDKSSTELGMGPETRGQQAAESKGDSGQLQPFDVFHCCLCPREALVSEPGAVNPGDPEGRGFGQQRTLGTSSD